MSSSPLNMLTQPTRQQGEPAHRRSHRSDHDAGLDPPGLHRGRAARFGHCRT